jgi:hypothetical protein
MPDPSTETADVIVTDPGEGTSMLQHPHGIVGYVVADHHRTGNAVRLARWAIGGTVLTMLVLAAALVLALRSPAAAGLLTAGSLAANSAVGLTAWRRHRTTRRRATPRMPPTAS